MLGLDNIEENVGKVNLLFGLRDDHVSKARINVMDKSAWVDMTPAMDDKWRAGIQTTNKRPREKEGGKKGKQTLFSSNSALLRISASASSVAAMQLRMAAASILGGCQTVCRINMPG